MDTSSRKSTWYEWFRTSAPPGGAPTDVMRSCRTVDPAVRHVVLVKRGLLVAMSSRMGPIAAPTDFVSSDRFEETVVNPCAKHLTVGATRLSLWDGPPALIVRYPGLYALVLSTAPGHVTLSVDRGADSIRIADAERAIIEASASEARP